MGLIKKKQSRRNYKEVLLTSEVPFVVEEAYKSLRTNLIFSLPEDRCKMIGVTSSSKNEGKSVTAINLAISLAKNGMKVLLIDCDLRLPSVARKLRIPSRPGLTNLLFGMNDAEEVLYHHSCGLDIMPAGDLPPNPSEILGSSSMEKVFEFAKENYEYVIFDAPPIGVVTDAAVLASKISGMIVVVRQSQADFDGVDMAVNKLKLANGKILGFVLTDSTTAKREYSDYGYGYGYARASKQVKDEKTTRTTKRGKRFF